ncbi:unnamed protein product [marine sediment metagenome]|uniref:Uncharacterized protein n=1 Tax=marine sediment metagenome TaxID=412755 RepID=X1RYM7_9ZZZZ
MDKSKQRYDSKHKVTRIFLADYQLLKELSQRAGISMAECLHKLITRQPEVARQVPVTQPAFEVRAQPAFEARAQPAFEVVTQPAFPVSAPVALRVRLQPTIATNGSKVTAFRIKPKGVKYD